MITVEKLTIELCRKHPDFIFVFGDNLIQKGKAGQATIRDEPNAVGIPTKRLPSMKPNAFFSDKPDEFKAVGRAILHLNALHKKGIPIVFPAAGLGTGLAKMHTESPKLFKALQTALNKYFTEVL